MTPLLILTSNLTIQDIMTANLIYLEPSLINNSGELLPLKAHDRCDNKVTNHTKDFHKKTLLILLMKKPK